jgi:hypothetical protein
MIIKKAIIPKIAIKPYAPRTIQFSKVKHEGDKQPKGVILYPISTHHRSTTALFCNGQTDLEANK